MSKNVLVVGGAGFIGSHLTERLLEDGHNVRILDNLARRPCLPWGLVRSGDVNFHHGDMRDRDAVDRAVKGMDVVFLKAATGVKRCIPYPQECAEVNIIGNYNVFRAAEKEGVSRLLFDSSSSVYGDPVRLPMDEEHPIIPVEPYGAAKACAESYLRFVTQETGLPHIMFRYFNVYGPRQSTEAYYTSVVLSFVKRILDGEAPMIDGEGEQSMDFTYVGDVVEANMCAMNGAIINETFNVGPGKETTIADLAGKIVHILGSDVQPRFSGKQSLVTRRCSDSSKIEKMLGFRCRVSLDKGIRELIDDIKANRSFYESLQ